MDRLRKFAINHVYSAYGLIIGSQIALPELQTVASQVSADVVIRFGPVDWAPDRLPQNGHGMLQHADATTSHYFWEETGPISVLDGREIRINVKTEAEPSSLRLPILGQLMALILLQRGHLVLHASAVAFEEHGLIFAGDNRSGKSTLAAALHARGYGFLSDDVVALNGAEAPNLLPAFPRMKLWPEALSLLENDPDSVPKLINGYEKRDYRVAQGYCDQPSALARIYILREGDEVALEPLTPIDALKALLPHSFGNRLGWNEDDERKAQDFKQLTSLVKRVPAFLLTRSNGRDSLAVVAGLVEEHGRKLRNHAADKQLNDGPE